MDISLLDKNLKIETTVSKDDIVWLDAADKPFKVYGAFDTNPYIRMSTDIAKTVSEGVSCLNANTAGVRIRFKTNSPYIALHCEWNSMCHMGHMPILGSSGFDLYKVSKSGTQSYVKSYIPSPSSNKGFDSIYDTAAVMTEYVLNLPLYNSLEKLAIGVQKNSLFEDTTDYINENNPVVFYGSSITQGGCASRPGNCYQNYLSREFNVDYINLGFSGNGKAEKEMIDYLCGLKMSAFVSDYDHNAPTVEHLESTHSKLYEEIRKNHPDLPYIMISKPDYNYDNNSNLRRCVVLNTFINAIKNGDKNVYLVDGASIFADDEWNACTVDGCHPNDLGFYRFYKALYPIFKRLFR